MRERHNERLSNQSLQTFSNMIKFLYLAIFFMNLIPFQKAYRISYAPRDQLEILYEIQ